MLKRIEWLNEEESTHEALLQEAGGKRVPALGRDKYNKKKAMEHTHTHTKRQTNTHVVICLNSLNTNYNKTADLHLRPHKLCSPLVCFDSSTSTGN